ncbi:MAG: type II toxin-antitoxin system RelE/ParE family toxin [Planctomycetaceae bacterium]|nr:type II toxin-antitoxin system RelE/ParE family toxin [Planctomycetales bacterium]MCB9872727.1 type II toxin-antitoxin system RelE/ParE family toxin [Planctomycetaceae bacterium]MCB9926213.1 type II toxin-antitoxin system RelE/ParE family toxin [Planctomycetaceae bacterium]
MDKQIGIRPQARLDVVELATYIGQDNVAAANRFLDACAATFDFLSKSPQIGAIYRTKNWRLNALRVFRVRGFPNHLTFYFERATGIEIVRVVHGARDLDALLKDT